MPDPDPVSPAYINGRRSRIKPVCRSFSTGRCGMTTFLTASITETKKRKYRRYDKSEVRSSQNQICTVPTALTLLEYGWFPGMNSRVIR